MADIGCAFEHLFEMSLFSLMYSCLIYSICTIAITSAVPAAIVQLYRVLMVIIISLLVVLMKRCFLFTINSFLLKSRWSLVRKLESVSTTWCWRLILSHTRGAWALIWNSVKLKQHYRPSKQVANVQKRKRQRHKSIYWQTRMIIVDSAKQRNSWIASGKLETWDTAPLDISNLFVCTGKRLAG